MKSKIQWAGIIAIVAFIGFTLSCKDPLDPPPVQTVETPTASPAEGTYTGAQSVTLTSATGGASIFYTIDDSAPTAASNLYSDSAPITISQTTTLKAIAVKAGMNNSGLFTALYTINDSGKTLSSIAVTTQPTKTQYNLNETLSTAGMVVTATYSDNSTEAVTGYTTSGFSSTTAGSKTVTVTYEGKTADFTVMVNAPGKTLSSIAVTTQPTKTQYNLNEALSTAGMVVTATYSDNSTEVITAGYTTSGFDSTTAGSKTVTVSYGGKTATFTVTVNAPKTLQNIAITTPPTKTQYNLNETPLNTAGMAVTATYSDNSTEVITTGYTTSGFSSSAVGSKTVTVTYNGKTATFTVTVIDPNPVITTVTSWKGLTVPSATAAQQYSSYQGKTDALHVAPANTSNGYAYNVLSYSLAAYANQEITITVSMQVWLDLSTKVAWQINRSPWTTVAGNTSTTLSAGQWHTVQGTATITPQSGDVMYLSKDQLVGNPASVGTPPGNVELYITGFTVTIQVGNETILHTKWPFKVGAAAPGSAFTPSNGQYPLLRQFEVLVAENDMKPDAVMPISKPANFNTSNNQVNNYRWTNADRLVNYAEANSTAIRGHVLIWHSQTPAWFFTGSGVSGRATKAELYTNMETHIKTVFQKYGNRVGWWDVCNEVVADGGGPRAGGDPASGGSRYTQIMEDSGATGMDRYEYVLKAFQWARQYADANGGQNVKLYLTDYNNEYNGNKQNSFSDLVDWLITNNAPIDGVGFQTHIRYDWPSTTDISNAIDRFAGKGLMTQVCELDMSVFPGGSDTTLTDSVLAERLALQATKYRVLFDIYKTKYNEGKLDMVLVWGLADGASWLNNRPSGRVDHPLLFDRDFQPKPAYNRLVE